MSQTCQQRTGGFRNRQKHDIDRVSRVDQRRVPIDQSAVGPILTSLRKAIVVSSKSGGALVEFIDVSKDVDGLSFRKLLGPFRIAACKDAVLREGIESSQIFLSKKSSNPAFKLRHD